MGCPSLNGVSHPYRLYFLYRYHIALFWALQCFAVIGTPRHILAVMGGEIM